MCKDENINFQPGVDAKSYYASVAPKNNSEDFDYTVEIGTYNNFTNVANLTLSDGNRTVVPAKESEQVTPLL
jgi:hypothetical protein